MGKPPTGVSSTVGGSIPNHPERTVQGDGVDKQAAENAQPTPAQQAAAVAAVLAVLQTGPALGTAVVAISAALKMPKPFVLAGMLAARYKPGKKQVPATGGAVPATLAGNLRYRAAFLVNAFRRLRSAPGLQAAFEREKQLFKAHQQASQRRLAAAQEADRLRQEYGTDILGWYGVKDAATTPDCRYLIGRNYDATRPPAGLHPGARHPRCRCYPGPAFPGKTVVRKMPAVFGRPLIS